MNKQQIIDLISEEFPRSFRGEARDFIFNKVLPGVFDSLILTNNWGVIEGSKKLFNGYLKDKAKELYGIDLNN